jgi:hypothetical protein
VPLDQPRGVVAVDEAADGLAQLVDGVVQLGPQALPLRVRIQRSAQPLVSGSPRKAASSAMPSQPMEPRKWPERYRGPQSWRRLGPRATSGPRPPKRSMTASSTGWRAAKRSPTLATWAQASALSWSTQANTHTQPSARVQAMVASVPQRWLGAAGMIVPSWAVACGGHGLVGEPAAHGHGAAAGPVCR